jgi:hypothetical protein
MIRKQVKTLSCSSILARTTRSIEPFDGTATAEFSADLLARSSVAEPIAAIRGSEWARGQRSDRQRMEKAVKSLQQLGFKDEAKALESQAQASIFKVEQRQRYILTLNQSDDYPRQPVGWST